MALTFLGRGSGFSDDNTSAYFITDEHEMVIIDCGFTAFRILKKMELLRTVSNLYVLITHTHGDHVGGLSLFVQYVYYVLKKTLTIIAPSKEVAEDLEILMSIEGCDDGAYEIVTSDKMQEHEWFKQSIKTWHAPKLFDKCFGYQLSVNGRNVVYTGDTSTLVPFTKYLRPGSILYVDMSVHYGKVHLKLDEITLAELITITKAGIKVFLMHLDDVDAAKAIVARYDNIEVVPVYYQ